MDWWRMGRPLQIPQICAEISGTKKQPKPKLFGPDIFGWGGGLPGERVGTKEFGTFFQTRKNKLFRGISRGCPTGLRTKEVLAQFSNPKTGNTFPFWARGIQ